MGKEPVSIIVVTYNRIDYFRSFVEFLYLLTSYPFKLIVVDNGSVDGTRELIMKLKNDGLVHEYVFNVINIPLAAAFTAGYIKVDTELFVTVADDMLPCVRYTTPCWLEIFVAKIKSDEKIGCINFVGARCDKKRFDVKQNIYNTIIKNGGEKYILFNKIHKLIYADIPK